jgi:hypothetical protein
MAPRLVTSPPVEGTEAPVEQVLLKTLNEKLTRIVVVGTYEDGTLHLATNYERWHEAIGVLHRGIGFASDCASEDGEV